MDQSNNIKEPWQKVMYFLHAKLRDAYPTYPAQPTLSDAIAVTETTTLHFDVTIHQKSYVVIMVMDPMAWCCIRVRQPIKEGDDLLAVVMTIINVHYQRFVTLRNLLASVTGIGERYNLLEGGSILHEANRIIARLPCSMTSSIWNPQVKSVEACFIAYLQQLEASQGAGNVYDLVNFYYAHLRSVGQRHIPDDIQDPLDYALVE